MPVSINTAVQAVINDLPRGRAPAARSVGPLLTLVREIEDPRDERSASLMLQRIMRANMANVRELVLTCRQEGRSAALIRTLARAEGPEADDLLRAMLRGEDGQVDRAGLNEALEIVAEEGRDLRRAGEGLKGEATPVVRRAGSSRKPSGSKATSPKEHEDERKERRGLGRRLLDALEGGRKAWKEFWSEIVDWAEEKVGDIVVALRKAGERLDDIVESAIEHGEKAIRKLVSAVRKVASALDDVLDACIDLVEKNARRVIKFLRELGDRVEDMLAWAARQVAKVTKWLVGALLEAGNTLRELLVAILGMAEKAALTLIKALGKKAGELLEAMRSSGLETLKRLLALLVKAAMPVVELASWVARQPEERSMDLIHAIARALEEAAKPLGKLLDWAVSAAGDWLKRVLARLCEDSALVRAIVTWAEGSERLQALGEALATARRVLRDVTLTVLGYMKDSGARFVRGLLQGGVALGELLAMATLGAAKVGLKLLAALLEAGTTLGAILRAALAAKEDRMERILEALHKLGRSLGDLADAAAQAGREVAEVAMATLKKLGFAAADILMSLLQVPVNNLMLLVTLVLERFGEHRPLTDEEIKAGKNIFGKALKLDLVRVSELDVDRSLLGRLLAKIPPDQRPSAFTTLYLVNVPDWSGSKRRRAEISTSVLIHELTHIWQGEQVGPLYMLEALVDQRTADDYNYGYEDSTTGEGAQSTLEEAKGDFSQFNREQQASIIEHYYVRRYELDLDYSAWEPYARAVYAA